MKHKLFVFDTTLRDGEQSPGAKLSTDQKVELAKQLERLGVDVIEAGFPISSPGDFQSVLEIGKVVRQATVCALTRAVRADIDAARDALRFVVHPRIHTGIGASDVHIRHKLHSTREQVLAQGVDAVRYAKQFVSDVEFFAEDAGRADDAFLARMVEAVILAGATVVNIPDTTGYCFPEEFGKKIRYLFTHVAHISRAIISVHCHNDLGLATANALAGVHNGARQVEVTVNGIGERAGNTSLEEVVMAIYTRRDSLPYTVGVRTREIVKTSKMVSHIMGIPVQPNKAIVGANAFSHSSGIHQDGVLKRRENYEIIDPKAVGLDASHIVLTARSGRAALRHKFEEVGLTFSDDTLASLYGEFLKLADQKKEIYEEDLMALLDTMHIQASQRVRFLSLSAVSGNRERPHADVTLEIDKAIRTKRSEGNGAIDACYHAIELCLGTRYPLKEFLIQAATAGSDALARVTVALEKDGRICWGTGVNTDTVVAAALAYIHAVNKFFIHETTHAV